MASPPTAGIDQTPAEPALPLPADPPARRWLAAAFSTLVSLALLAMIADQFRHLDLAEIAAMVPDSPLFWLTFAAWYLVMPLSEWIIYRRLWTLPLAAIGALLRKLVSNELLLGYLGEAQFYAWARSRVEMTTAPFGAIKDVTVLSALIGNIVSLVMLLAAWPLVTSNATGLELETVFISLGVVLVTSFAMLLLRGRLFTLPRGQLWFISAVHLVRIVVLIGLSALMWHWVLPGVAITLWLVLATLRMLVSRLPLIPNKDVVFAGLAVFLLGKDANVAEMLTMMAGLVLLAHLAVGGAVAIVGVVEDLRRRGGAAGQE